MATAVNTHVSFLDRLSTGDLTKSHLPRRLDKVTRPVDPVDLMFKLSFLLSAAQPYCLSFPCLLSATWTWDSHREHATDPSWSDLCSHHARYQIRRYHCIRLPRFLILELTTHPRGRKPAVDISYGCWYERISEAPRPFFNLLHPLQRDILMRNAGRICFYSD